MKAVVAALALSLAVGVAAADAQGSYHRRGYVTKNGTYVQPSRATRPDSSKMNNWSTKGNVNPYTGKAGTRDPYAPRPARKRR